MVDQRPSRAFAARYEGECHGVACSGPDRDVRPGDRIRLHHGLVYHDDPVCLPALTAWGETRPAAGGPAEPHDPWE